MHKLWLLHLHSNRLREDKIFLQLHTLLHFLQHWKSPLSFCEKKKLFWAPSFVFFLSRIHPTGFNMSPCWCYRTGLLKLHPLLVIMTSIQSCPVCSTTSLFEKVSVQKIVMVLQRHLLSATFSSVLLSSDNTWSHTARYIWQGPAQLQFGWYCRGSDFREQLQWQVYLKSAVKLASSVRSS